MPPLGFPIDPPIGDVYEKDGFKWAWNGWVSNNTVDIPKGTSAALTLSEVTDDKVWSPDTSHTALVAYEPKQTLVTKAEAGTETAIRSWSSLLID